MAPPRPVAAAVASVNNPFWISTWPAGVGWLPYLLLYWVSNWLMVLPFTCDPKAPLTVPGSGSWVVPSPVKSVWKIAPGPLPGTSIGTDNEVLVAVGDSAQDAKNSRSTARILERRIRVGDLCVHGMQALERINPLVDQLHIESVVLGDPGGNQEGHGRSVRIQAAKGATGGAGST